MTTTYLLGEMSNGSAKLSDSYPRGWGRMYVERPINPFDGEPWALDNGVFRAWNNDEDYAPRFRTFEKKLHEASSVVYDRGSLPLFVVIPDRPADPDSILESLAWLEEYELDGLQEEVDPFGHYYGSGYGLLPLALAVQDGMSPEALEELRDPETDEPILSKLAYLFVGGSDDFKETVGIWRELADRWGLKLHFGRATQSRIRDAVSAGSDSADSAHPVRLGGSRWTRFLEVADKELAKERVA